MTDFLKPSHLKPGDTIAVVSLSWGGPSVFPRIFDEGLKHLREDFGLIVKEFPTARMDADLLHANPQLRAKDVNDAFADKEIKAIFSSIGGDDSVRMLPFLDKELIRKNPKIVMGYSDTTTLLTFCNQLGLVTFNGPSIMAGFSEMDSLSKEFAGHVKDILFNNLPAYQYKPYEKFSEGYPDWAKMESIGLIKNEQVNDGWHWLQGSGTVQGPLFGGCVEVLEYFLKGTEYWPEEDFWNGKILFCETSEEKPPVSMVEYFLRGLGMQGVFPRITGIVFGRARDYTAKEKAELDQVIVTVVAKEFGCPNIPIVTNMDFGHTDPQWIVPLGVKAEIDCEKKTFGLIESACL